MLKTLSVLVAVLITTPAWADDTCQVIGSALYNDGTCATVVIKNIERGSSRLGGKIIAVGADGQQKEKRFTSNRISEGDSYTTNMCWGRNFIVDHFDCKL